MSDTTPLVPVSRTQVEELRRRFGDCAVVAKAEQDLVTWERHLAELKEANDAARARRLAAEEAEQSRRKQERDPQALSQIKDMYRARYLSQPGTDEAGFETEWPKILADHRYRETLRDPVAEEKAAMVASGRYPRL